MKKKKRKYIIPTCKKCGKKTRYLMSSNRDLCIDCYIIYSDSIVEQIEQNLSITNADGTQGMRRGVR